MNARKAGDSARVEFIDGEPVLVISGRSTIEQLCAVLERADSRLRWQGEPTLQAAAVVVPAARAVVALIDLTGAVPTAEPAVAPEGAIGASWITTGAAAQLLQISDRAVRKRIESGSLEAKKAGGCWLISTKELHDAAA